MKSRASAWIGSLIILGYFAMQAALFTIEIPLSSELATIITGSVKAIEGLTYIVVGYYFGSSEGSQRKDEINYNANSANDGLRQSKDESDDK